MAGSHRGPKSGSKKASKRGSRRLVPRLTGMKVLDNPDNLFYVARDGKVVVRSSCRKAKQYVGSAHKVKVGGKNYEPHMAPVVRIQGSGLTKEDLVKSGGKWISKAKKAVWDGLVRKGVITPGGPC